MLNAARRVLVGCRSGPGDGLRYQRWDQRNLVRALRYALGVALACAPATLRAQVTISSAANQLFHVNDPARTISPVTVTDVSGGNIKFNRDIRITIPAGFNMTWDTSVLTATL